MLMLMISQRHRGVVDGQLPATALPPPYISAAKALNNIRNAYAHREDHAITSEELNSLKVRWEPIQKKAYAAALIKGPGDAAQIAVIFLNWSFLQLLHPA